MDFQKFQRSPSLLLLFFFPFLLLFPVAATSIFVAPRRGRKAFPVDIDNNKKSERRLPASIEGRRKSEFFDRGDVGILGFERLVSESEENARGSTEIPLFDSPFRSFAILDFFDLCWISNVSKDNRNILRRRKNYLDLTYSKIYSNMFVYVCIRVSSCFQRIFFLFSR